MGIKLGNIDISSFKVGGADCSIYLGDTKLYPQSQPPHDYSQDYLTVRALGSGDVKWSGSTTSNTLSYSTDNGATWSSPSSEITVSVNSGDAVLFKGECTPDTNKGIGRFSGTTANFDVEGNIMSLLHGDNFVGQTSLGGTNFVFGSLFKSCTSLASAENLSLLATTLDFYCYDSMFQGCSSLTTAPQLPATKLANSCYSSMFENCTSLTAAPELPATTLISSCYEYMFHNCRSLTTAPTLPATTLERQCYYFMFYGCTSLSSITCLATNISAVSCTSSWLGVVASSGTFTTPSSTSWASGVSGIPSGWTRVDYNE